MAGIAEPAASARSKYGRPHPPGDYPVIVVGSGPGGVQTSYCLRRLGVAHATISRDPEPGGMFRRFPLFQRLITWTKPHAPADPATRAYERYDWNSLLAEEPELRALVRPLMDGTSYFPSRAEMESGIAAFEGKAAVPIRYGCAWTGTRRDDEGFVVETTDGEYRCRVLVLAVGMTEPWTPDIPGLDEAPHYVSTRPAREYAGRRVFVVGKRNSGFEIADGLLPVARQVILGSPRPPQLSVFTHSTAAARARYLQPYEDHVLGGGVLVLDAAIERVDRGPSGWRVHASGTTNEGSFVFEVDDVISATGFRAPLLDLADLGVATFYGGGRLPAQTPFWESASVPGIYFAGNITQGSIGLKKYGIPSNSGAVHGFRYNARVLARHIAETHFGAPRETRPVGPEELTGFLLEEMAAAPELWNQQSYLARVVAAAGDGGFTDEGIRPLAHFVDEAGPDAVAVAIETDDRGEIRPVAYLRKGQHVSEHVLQSHPLLDFRSEGHKAELEALVGSLGAG